MDYLGGHEDLRTFPSPGVIPLQRAEADWGGLGDPRFGWPSIASGYVLGERAELCSSSGSLAVWPH